MAKRILDMLKWHPEMDSANCKIIYSHRSSRGNLKTIPVNDIQGLVGGFMIMFNGSTFPYHRIVQIECDDKLICKKGTKMGGFDD